MGGAKQLAHQQALDGAVRHSKLKASGFFKTIMFLSSMPISGLFRVNFPHFCFKLVRRRRF
jgi:hypothetical protein